MLAITEQEFQQFQRFIFEAAGITIGDGKRMLVTSRLSTRIQQLQLANYGDYFRLISGGKDPEEVQKAIDLLTTNETYFFREQAHFDFMRNELKASIGVARTQPHRVWSAAGSSGEEAYSIAMVLEDCLRGKPWEVLASDISLRVLQRARAGQYPMERARNVPLQYLQRFCLAGQGKLEHTLLVERALRNRVKFQQINLNAPLPPIGPFDFVFLRNVMIYFNQQTKRDVIARVLTKLKPDGWLFTGHSESLHGVSDDVVAVAPAIYRRR